MLVSPDLLAGDALDELPLVDVAGGLMAEPLALLALGLQGLQDHPQLVDLPLHPPVELVIGGRVVLRHLDVLQTLGSCADGHLTSLGFDVLGDLRNG